MKSDGVGGCTRCGRFVGYLRIIEDAVLNALISYYEPV